MKFTSRQDAGRRLGKYLRERGVMADMVLGLPRGGVVVAAEVARELKLPLDVLVVRKIGHPLNREFAVGALAEPDVFILDGQSFSQIPVARAQLEKVVAEETARLREYRLRFRHAAAPSLNDKSVLLVDDGLATGATAEAAVISARQQNARRIIISAPAASASAFEKLERVADEVVVLTVDADFGAVGQYYEHFAQTTDYEVLELLNNAVPRKE
jgi:predicted phosphoribosyltransferase